MGWKAVKDHYGIEYTVYKVGENLMIGSGGLPEMVRISPKGEVLWTWEYLGKEIIELVERLRSDADTFAKLFAQPDTFSESIPTYTFEDGEIVECLSDTPDPNAYHNVTHDGRIMWCNRFFGSYNEAKESMIREIRAYIALYESNVDDARESLTKNIAELQFWKQRLMKSWSRRDVTDLPSLESADGLTLYVLPNGQHWAKGRDDSYQVAWEKIFDSEAEAKEY